MIDFEQKYQKERMLFLAKSADLLTSINWSKELLHSVEKSLDMQDNYNQLLFPGGISDVLLQFEGWQNQKMLSLLIEVEEPSKVRSKIALALKVRIIDIITKEALLRHLSHLSLPQNMLQNLQNHLNVSNLIWQYAGDRSTDFNYYTKRGLLVSVYAAAQAFYISDDSKDFIKTQEFIENSLNQVVNLAKLIKK